MICKQLFDAESHVDACPVHCDIHEHGSASEFDWCHVAAANGGRQWGVFVVPLPQVPKFFLLGNPIVIVDTTGWMCVWRAWLVLSTQPLDCTWLSTARTLWQ